jgi:hypothetical protein
MVGTARCAVRREATIGTTHTTDAAARRPYQKKESIAIRVSAPDNK